MSDPDKMFARDIELYQIGERDSDAQTEIILKALREGLSNGQHPMSYFRDDPKGTTEIEGEYDLLFIAKVIRAALP